MMSPTTMTTGNNQQQVYHCCVLLEVFLLTLTPNLSLRPPLPLSLTLPREGSEKYCNGQEKLSENIGKGARQRSDIRQAARRNTVYSRSNFMSTSVNKGFNFFCNDLFIVENTGRVMFHVQLFPTIGYWLQNKIKESKREKEKKHKGSENKCTTRSLYSLKIIATQKDKQPLKSPAFGLVLYI